MDKTSLGDRMKAYEQVPRLHLTRRSPVILRVDGRAFHTYTRSRGFARPFCNDLHGLMRQTAEDLVAGIQGAKVAYGQSDEISILVTDYDTLTTDAWFGYGVQKMVSIASSIATASFNRAVVARNWTMQEDPKNWAMFDARAFTLPREEVTNYFIWRQQDASRNSVQMLARSEFSHKECHGKSCVELQDMLMLAHGINWNNTPTIFKRGFCVSRDGYDPEIPVFTQDREYLENFVHPAETVVN